MAKRTPPLDVMKYYLASAMELIALGEAIHYYLDAAQCGQISDWQQKHIVPLLASFQTRLVEQLEEKEH